MSALYLFILFIFQKREYCAKTVSLQTAALKGVLWDEDNASDLYEDVPSGLGFLVPFVSLARAVHVMHEKDWIIRDLKADTILIDCNNGEVCAEFTVFSQCVHMLNL